MKNVFYYKTKIGNMEIVSENKKIISISLTDTPDTSLKLHETAEIKQAAKELNLYLEGKLKTFSMPIHFSQTPFQNKVYEETLKLGYGETISYQDLAIRMGKPLAARAVGNALNKNKIMIVIPCHRIIGKNNKLTGYFYGVSLKQQLLYLEKKNKD